MAEILRWAVTALLIACSAGGPAGGGAAGGDVSGSGGGGGDGGSGGGNAVAVGGPVGGTPISAPGGAGASGAAGTVSLPAPGYPAIEPVVDLLVMSIECTNVRGPNVDCRGLEGSAPAGASLRLSVHPPLNLGTVTLGTPINVTVSADGSWSGSLTANGGNMAGLMIQICLLKDGLCDESLFLTVPPEGGVVNGAQGIKKNLVIDADGNIFYTQNRILSPKVKWSWTSLFIAPAYALDPVVPGGGTGFQLTPEAARALIGDRPLVDLEMTFNATRYIAADCPSQPATISPAVTDTGSRMGNRATVWMQNKFNIGRFPQRMAWIPGVNRDQIKDLATISWSRPGGGGKDNFLAAAVHNFVYLIRYTETGSTLETRVEFPQTFHVSQLISTGPFIYVLLSSKAGGAAPAYPVYRIYRDLNYAEHAYSGPLVAMCAPASPALSSLKSIEQMDDSNSWIAGVGLTETGKYRLFVGSPEIRDDLIDFPPVVLKEYNHPVEVKIVGRDYGGIGLAVLDPIDKKLTMISYNWATDPSTADFRETNLASLNLNFPRLLSIDAAGKLAFLDIAESGSRVYSYSFSGSGHDFNVARSLPTVFQLGAQAPTVLRVSEGAWSYNDAVGNMRAVESTPAYLEIDVDPDVFREPGPPLPGGGVGERFRIR